ncbi:biotin transporter BioY [candidate division KSB1 bacterium]|nr:biotin transporter BioY [candidate division KSB1 bacterium]
MNKQINVRYIILVALFAALTAIGAFIKLPIPHVPVTLQTLIVLLSGSLLGWRLGGLSQLVYLAVGLAGIPVFTNGGGPGYVMQPTFGYLASYPLVAVTVGALLRYVIRKSGNMDYFKILLVQCIGIIPMFIIGVSWLFVSIHYFLETPFTIKQAIWSGCIIFLPIEFIKVLIASYITIRLKTVLFVS